MIKKILEKTMVLIAVVIFIGTVNVLAADNNHITVYVNDSILDADVNAQIINSITMVPMRAIFETLGAEVIWDETNETVTAKKNGTEISLKINDNKMTKNGWEIELDAPAILLSDHTMLPLRAVSEAFGAAVTWDEQNRIVNIEFI